jgi:hypothetical protein
LSAVAVAAVVAAPSATAAPPAVDEYTLRIPTAGGAERPTTAPEVRPGELPTAVALRLERAADGPALTQIATATALGAPQSVPESKPEGASVPAERSILASASASLGGPAGLVGAALLAVGLAAFLARSGRRARS